MNTQEYHQKKIMIVDDDPDIVTSLQQLFLRYGFEVVTAENGRDCLRELEKGFQGIIILDLMMPVMNGLETIKRIYSDGFLENNSIIVLTAKRVQGNEFDDIYPYINDYIVKPFEIDTLLQSVQKIAKRPPRRDD